MSDTPATTTAVEPRRRFWSSEALVGAIVPIIGAIVFLGAHAVLVNDHVGQLERDREAGLIKHAAYEVRMSAIEATVALDRAASDKREALIEAELRDIAEKLATLQESVDHLQRRHP